MRLEGFTVYGTCKGGNHVLTVSASLLDPADHCVTTASADVNTDDNNDIYDVYFEETPRLARSTLYTLVVDISGTQSYTYAGAEGRLTAFDGDVIFTFCTSEKSVTATCVEKGQLPGLIFSPSL